MHLTLKSEFYNGQKVQLINTKGYVTYGVIRIHDNTVYFCSNNPLYNGFPLPKGLKFEMMYSWVLSFDDADILLGFTNYFFTDNINVPDKSNNILFSKYKFLI